MMHRLTIIGLILALISITPASVLVCSAVHTPELIVQLNGERDFHFEIDCAPQSPSVHFSAAAFSSFLQTGFFTAFHLSFFLLTGVYCLFENEIRTILGFIVTPPTPPPTPLLT